MNNQLTRQLRMVSLLVFLVQPSILCAQDPSPVLYFSFDADTGLMKADGTPGELLLPWRTTAYMISGTQYLGSIVMPGGSRNYILTRGDEAIMIVWNEKKTEEVINLGNPQDIEHIDL